MPLVNNRNLWGFNPHGIVTLNELAIITNVYSLREYSKSYLLHFANPLEIEYLPSPKLHYTKRSVKCSGYAQASL